MTRFSVAITIRKLDKYVILTKPPPFLAQEGWDVLPPIVIAIRIHGYIHTPTLQCLLDFKIPTTKDNKLREFLSQIST